MLLKSGIGEALEETFSCHGPTFYSASYFIDSVISAVSKVSLISTKTLKKIKCYVKITFLVASSGWEDSSII